MQAYLWNPWSIFDELERSMFAAGSSEWPQFDIEGTDDETVLSADLPGMGEDDVEVSVSAAHSSAGSGSANGTTPIRSPRASRAASSRSGSRRQPRPSRVGSSFTSGGLAAKVKGVLGDDKDNKQAA